MIHNEPLKSGNIGIGVNKMQGYLNLTQHRNFISTRNLQDGVLGTRTEQAVREWQSYAGLPVTGQIDVMTWDTIVNKLRELNIVTNIPVASRSFFLSSGAQGISVYKMQEYLNEIAAKNPNTPIDIVINIIGASGFNSTINLLIIWKPDLLFILANLPNFF